MKAEPIPHPRNLIANLKLLITNVRKAFAKTNEFPSLASLKGFPQFYTIGKTNLNWYKTGI